MVKSLISVGNSKAVILPSEMVKRHKLDRVVIEETPEGILIRSANREPTSLEEAVNLLRKNKKALYQRVETQANDQETIGYYENTANNLSEVDTDILE